MVLWLFIYFISWTSKQWLAISWPNRIPATIFKSHDFLLLFLEVKEYCLCMNEWASQSFKMEAIHLGFHTTSLHGKHENMDNFLLRNCWYIFVLPNLFLKTKVTEIYSLFLPHPSKPSMLYSPIYVKNYFRNYPGRAWRTSRICYHGIVDFEATLGRNW